MNRITLLRFTKYVQLDIISGCWNWTGGKTTTGYGRFHNGEKLVSSHRIAYEHWNGKIPNVLVIDHLCRNPSCVNPAHLEVVTQKENILRGIGISAVNAKKTHCKRGGHELVGDNLMFNKSGGRLCRICKNIRNLAFYHRKREELCP